MEEASSVLLNYFTNLHHSDITFNNFHTMKRYKTKFMEIFEITQPVGVEDVEKEFEKKEQLNEDYKNTKNVMNFLGNFLKDIPEKLGKLFMFFAMYNFFFNC